MPSPQDFPADPAAIALPPALSLTLDAWRLAAALAVVFCHFGSQRMSGGLLWQLTPYGAQAVDVFFVLSGYVIAYAAATRETAPRSFALSRLARLWSVAMPAAAATFALDAAGRAIEPAAYAGLPGDPAHIAVIWQAVAGLLFVNQLWQHALPVGANVPWWSLGFEASYYLAFFCLTFGGRTARVAGPALVALAAGPVITILSLLWWTGAAIRRQHAKGETQTVAWPALLVPPALWICFEAACRIWGRPLGIIPGLRPELLQDMFVGGVFALHLWQAPSLLARLPPVPPGLATVIRYGASRSFTIYLFHYPVMLFLRAAMLRLAPTVSPFWLLPATLAVCFAAAGLTERRKGAWRRILEAAWPEEAATRPPAASAAPPPRA